MSIGRHRRLTTRIAYDHQIFVLQRYGGISRYFVELAKNLATVPDVAIRVVSPLHLNSYLADASGQVRVSGLYMPEMRYTWQLRYHTNRLLVPRLLEHFRPHLVHETFFSDRRIAPAESKTVVTVYDMIFELFPDYMPAARAMSATKRIAVERADHVICISEQTRKDLIAIWDLDAAKTSVVHLGLSLTQPPAKKDVTTARPFLLYVGDRAGYKNFQILLHAYAANQALRQEYDLVVFGGGTLTEQELALMRKLGIDQSRVRQIGGDDSVLAGIYQKAALFVYPSRYEGFGLPPLEAMSFDCPVVCSNVSSIPEVVGDAAELFDPDSPAELSAAVERVLDDDALRRALVERGRERIKLFSWERCAQQTLDVYREVLS